MIAKSQFILCRLRPVVVLLLLLCVAGCCTPMGHNCGASSEGKLPAVKERSIAEQALAEALWSYHEAAITEVLAKMNSKKHEPMAGGGRDFNEALTFFEATTGILSNTGTRFGRIITPDLPETLDRWRQWHREHRNELHFDEVSCDLGTSPI